MKGCKNCPAYAKCTVTYRGSACAALRGTYGIDSDPEIITNADRIRAMSDEELAEFLAEEQYRIANVIFQTAGYGLEKQAIYARRLDWLQQPAEEDT